MSYYNILAFATAEKRLTGRLSRYWIFLGLAYIISVGLLIFKSVLHAFGSSVSASAGILSPRYNITESGSLYLFCFIIGIIFLAFDVRARDSRERMLEILDSRPYSNLDLVLGRFLGLLSSTWKPVVTLVVIIQVLGWLLPQLGSPFGRTLEPFSLFSFPLFIALPAMAFICALIILITLLARRRFIALVLSLAVIVGLYFLSVRMPVTVSSAIDLLGFFQVNIPSDWVPSIAINFSGWLQRVGIMVLAFGLLLFAVLVHPRLEDESRVKQLSIALGTTLVGVLLIVTVNQLRGHEVETMEQWRLVHEEKRDQVFPDIVSMQGMVAIKPGKDLVVELDIVFKAPPNTRLKQALFSLNPGFEINQVIDAQGNALIADFQNGLLEISLLTPLVEGEEKTVQLQFRGSPNLLFAYLDSHINPRNLTSKDAQLRSLGIDNAIFDNRYVALMPGIHWLPASGVDVGRGDNRERARDFYDLQLKVQVPSHWIVAGPGLRTENNRTNELVEYGFSPQTSISEVAILAAPFKNYQTKIDDINFELLLHPDHDANIEVLKQGKEQIKLWIADKLSLARDAGLEYPFKAFSLVEVPNTLRGYTGGWRSGTALAPPSMVLMKESSLPTARFDFDAIETFGQGQPLMDEKDGAAKLIRNRLIEFFNNDFTGGNVFTGIARSFFAHQTSATGSDAIALDYTLQQLVTLVLSEQRSFFSVARIFDVTQSLGRTLGPDPRRGRKVSQRVMNSFKSDLNVWESALTSPLNDIDPYQNPALTVDLLALKGGGMAQVIYDILGPEKTGQVITQLLANHRGKTYTRDDVVAAGSVMDSELGLIIDDWFSGTGLAGFTVDQVSSYQLPANSNGDTRYQLRMRIKNDESVTGFARVSWSTTEESVITRSVPIRIPGHSAVEFGVVLFQPPADVYIEPYISLNRQDFLVKSFIGSEITSENIAAFSGVQEVARDAQDDGRIVVDDLDLAFSIATSKNEKGLRLVGKGNRQGGLDRGLPVVKGGAIPNQWSRGKSDSAWGKYRHTAVIVGPGDGNSKAVFTSQIPSAGRWELTIHLPNVELVRQKRLGDFALDIIDENDEKSVAFDAKAGVAGWNVVGEYELPAGDVKIAFSNKTDGEVVIADAVAWSKIN